MDRMGVVGQLAGLKDRVVSLSDNDVQVLLMPRSKVLSYYENENDDTENNGNIENLHTTESGSLENIEIEEIG